MGILLPVPIVAAALAFIYGRTIHHAWLPALITFCCVLLGGLLWDGIGEIVGVVVSALIVFLACTLPAQRRAVQEEAEREKDASQMPNEEDM